MKQMPKKMIAKIERMQKLMDQLVQLNQEVEAWMEENGIEDAFDFSYDYRDDRGYGIIDPQDYIDAINAEIN